MFLIADPARFEDVTRALCYTDGSQEENPAEAEIRWQDTVFAVEDCPSLVTVGKLLPDGMYIGRRGIWDDTKREHDSAGIMLWEAMTKNAISLQ